MFLYIEFRCFFMCVNSRRILLTLGSYCGVQDKSTTHIMKIKLHNMPNCRVVNMSNCCHKLKHTVQLLIH